MTGILFEFTVHSIVRALIPSNFRISKINKAGQTRKLSTISNIGMKFQKKYIQNCLQFPNFIIRRLFLTILLVVANSDINSQEAKSQEVKIADVHEIDRSPFPDASIYERINFPEPSIIIKKDGVTIYKKVEGSTVKHSLINMKW